jgi:hypothetical protein
MSQTTSKLFERWQEIEQKLGIDLEASAYDQNALLRRRGIRSASDLLRLVLVYCQEDWSLRLLGIWAVLQGIGYLSAVALLKRLRNSAAWLGFLMYHCLAVRGVELRESPGIHLSLRDATVINAPGSTGTEWRLHLKLDLGRRCISAVELTDAHGGESLARLPIEPGEIQVGDRGYSHAKGIGAVLHAGAHVVVRINWYNLPLWTATRTKVDLVAWLSQLSTPADQLVYLETPDGRFLLRVIAVPLPVQAAEEGRRRARKAATKKGHTVSAGTLLAAGFLLVVTDLPQTAWPIARILWLYRLRWQIELQFKAFKSLLHFDHLRAKDPRLVRTYLYAKLLIVLLLEQLTQQVQFQQPDWFTDLERPVSAWGLTAALVQPFRQLLIGNLSFDRFWVCLPALARYFRDSPRARINQLAYGQALLEHLAFHFPVFCC